MVSSKERGVAPFQGKLLDRLPFWYYGDQCILDDIMRMTGAADADEVLYQVLSLDYKTFRPQYIGPQKEKFPDGTEYNEWGIKRNIIAYSPAMNAPLAGVETMAEVERYPWPKIEEWDVSINPAEYQKYAHLCMIGGAWAPFFHDASELVGTEEFFLNLHSAPAVMEAIIEHCFQFYYELTERMFVQNPGKLDIFFMGNDFGTQRTLIISPQMFRNHFKPRLKKLFDLGHKYGLYTALHSCGSVRAIIPDLIEIGLDCLNPIQVSAGGMDPVELKREFGKDLVFFGGIDFNETIMRGSEEQVRKETRRIIEILGADNRYIVAPSHDHCIEGTPPKNIIALFDEARRFFSG